jgi:CRISPR/Cas system-associated protein endoribonuclease Cas2
MKATLSSFSESEQKSSWLKWLDEGLSGAMGGRLASGFLMVALLKKGFCMFKALIYNSILGSSGDLRTRLARLTYACPLRGWIGR